MDRSEEKERLLEKDCGGEIKWCEETKNEKLINRIFIEYHKSKLSIRSIVIFCDGSY